MNILLMAHSGIRWLDHGRAGYPHLLDEGLCILHLPACHAGLVRSHCLSAAISGDKLTFILDFCIVFTYPKGVRYG